jgi:hypothetical protein
MKYKKAPVCNQGCGFMGLLNSYRKLFIFMSLRVQERVEVLLYRMLARMIYGESSCEPERKANVFAALFGS